LCSSPHSTCSAWRSPPVDEAHLQVVHLSFGMHARRRNGRRGPIRNAWSRTSQADFPRSTPSVSGGEVGGAHLKERDDLLLHRIERRREGPDALVAGLEVAALQGSEDLEDGFGRGHAEGPLGGSMSKIGIAIVCLLAHFVDSAAAQSCQLAGRVAWSPQVRYLVSGCDSRFSSPAGLWILVIDRQGRIRIGSTDGRRSLAVESSAVEGPGIVSWSPKADAFVVNDGRGSGETSELRVFSVSFESVVERPNFSVTAVQAYRREKSCAAAALDPDVWGIGWSPDGTRLHVVAQATIHRQCGPVGGFLGFTMDVATGRIIQRLSESTARREFRGLLWPSLR
jgi:hypothetical protein